MFLNASAFSFGHDPLSVFLPMNLREHLLDRRYGFFLKHSPPYIVYEIGDIPAFPTFILSFFFVFLDSAVINLSTKKKIWLPAVDLPTSKWSINCTF